MNNLQKITVANDLNELEKINVFIDSFTNIWNIKDEIIYKINLAVEELFLNIIDYGYQDNKKHLISFEFINNIDSLIIKIVNDAIEFDIINYPTPELPPNIKERDIGGLGIFFIKKMVNHISSTNVNGINTIQLVINTN